ncbi:MAG: TIGR00341 family protein [Rikenellaceae bacterium]|nr:TIGR00341 family protein [Rikenellaceae bacterium]
MNNRPKRMLQNFLHDKFNLDEDKASQEEVMENVVKGVEFRGTNLWILIFATFIASLGLNVNSTAVIIGAMLISPLMGPIMGIGLSLGINDFDLLKKSVKNFGFMVAISILASTIYFLISPISTAQSELLARTVPTTYDVLIAFFGGLAGIVAQSRKDRTTTVIPGVAIATALMPPLCTAGYGLATLQFNFFIGAFYLFLINTVFIAFAAYFVVRFLKYDKKNFLDKQREKRVARYMAVILIATFVPSLIVGYKLIRKTIFDSNVERYISHVVNFENSQLIDHRSHYHRKGCEIELIMFGDPISNDAIANMSAQLRHYGLLNTKLSVHQPTEKEQIGFSILESNVEQILAEKNNQILSLEEELRKYTSDTLPATEIAREMAAIAKAVHNVSISKSITYDKSGNRMDTTLMCFINTKEENLTALEQETLSNWLRIRTNVERVKIYVE